jgi:2-(1,2-epoxy-1,2-dihydrophenyl)acetyl-CoA isomerase
MSSVLEQTIDERGIAILAMNRPQAANALSDELFAALARAFVDLDRREDVGVIVLTGKGRAFCAGGDITEMPGNTRELTFENRVANLLERAAIVPIIRDCSKLTIAMINGAAVGAGLALTLACDFRIGGASARFSTQYLNMALAGDCGVVYLLTHLLGEARAKELMFFPGMIESDRALGLGLLHRRVADESLQVETLGMAARLAAGPRVAQRYMKLNFRNTEQPFADALRTEADYLVRSAMTEDHAEAKMAFRERRAPVFKVIR